MSNLSMCCFDQDGKQYGDEYFAELDYIEVVERAKEGYESNADEDEGIEDDHEDEDSFDATAAKDSDRYVCRYIKCVAIR